MSGLSHGIDPEGDTLLTLLNPNAPFAVWPKNEKWTPLPQRPKQIPRDHPCPFAFQSVDNQGTSDDRSYSGTSQLTLRPATLTGQLEPKQPLNTCTSSSIRLRLSSRHLILASAYFKAALKGPWKESTTYGDCFQVQAEDWDTNALLLVMNILHARTRLVRRSVSLEMLAKIAVIVDYYECHEAVEFFVDMWINALPSPPSEYTRDLVLWLFISWIFSKAEIFKNVTRIFLLKARGPLFTLDLHIPQTVTDRLEKRRQELVKSVLDVLHDLLIYLRDERTKCSFQCTSTLLGVLVKEMQTWGLLSPRPEIPLLGYNFEDTAELALKFESPSWFAYSSYNSGYYDRNYRSHPCNLSQLISPMVKPLKTKLNGLDLKDFQYLRKPKK